MSASLTGARPDIYAFALAGLMRVAADFSSIDAGVRERLLERKGTAGRAGGSLLTAFKASLEDPHDADAVFIEVARQFSLTLVEILALRLAIAAEQDVEVSYVIAQLQAPIAGHRPTVGLLARAFHESLEASAAQIIGHGEAVRTGILRLSTDDARWPSARFRWRRRRCSGCRARWHPGPVRARFDRPCRCRSAAIRTSRSSGWRSSSRPPSSPRCSSSASWEPMEARAAVEQLCRQMECPAVLVETENLHGLAPWLFVQRAVPVFCLQLAPGDRRAAPLVPEFSGPTIVIAGMDGEFESEGRRITDWRMPIPGRDQRFELWRQHVPEPLARRLSEEHRHSAARIATLGREVARLADDGAARIDHVQAAARRIPNGLGALAETVLRRRLGTGAGGAARTAARPRRFDPAVQASRRPGRGVRPVAPRALPSGRARAVCRANGHRQDARRQLGRDAARAAALPRGPVVGDVEVHRRDREELEPAARAAPRPTRSSCSSTKPTRCSASAPRSAMRTTASPTRRPTSCCSGSRTYDGDRRC